MNRVIKIKDPAMAKLPENGEKAAHQREINLNRILSEGYFFIIEKENGYRYETL